jgi:hypothetical protein
MRNEVAQAPEESIMIVVRCLAVAVLLASSASCSSGPAPSAVGATPGTAATQNASAPTAEQVVADLTGKIGTAKPTVVFTAETDPNHLLGRPNGYTSKASFTDSRIKTSDVKDSRTGSVDQGGSVEIYPDEAGAATRKRLIDDTMKAAPILGTEYSYLDGPVLLRVSQALTPAQAQEYKSALTAD